MASGYSSEFVDFLSRPESYTHRPEHVKHIQTHISHVFIVPPYVYKFKKNVNLDFLDFSSLEQRRFYCEQEVKLNRRLCDEIYIGVVGVYRSGATWTFDETEADSNEAVEYAVQMKQLTDDRFLIHHVRESSLTYNHLDLVVDRLTEFYRNQKADETISQWGHPDKIRVNTNENFEQTEPFKDDTIDGVAYDSIRSFTNRFLDEYHRLFEKRTWQGRILDGHGDLRLDHIHIKDDRICIYDCIEFNDRFRYQDVGSDIAFLAMDLDFNECVHESNYFTLQLAEKLNDLDLLQLTDFYKCYRAYVRGKVKSIESADTEVNPADRKKAARLASRYFSLSVRYATFGSLPVVLVFMGKTASGKSTLADEAAGSLGIERHSSDIARKKLAGLPLEHRTPEHERERLYNNRMTDHTYQHLIEKAQENIRQGHSLILDATFSTRIARKKLLTSLEGTKAEICFIEVHASKETRTERLLNREVQKNVISDARKEDLRMLDRNYETPSEIESADLIKVTSDQPVNQSMKELFGKLSERTHFS